MKVEKIDLTINGDVKTPIEVILREGQASKIIEPKPVDITGTIESAKLYASKIEDKKKAVVTFSIENKTIELNSDPSDQFRHRIVGSLVDNEDFTDWGINKDKRFTSNELNKFVKSHANCFKDIEDAKKLVKNLQNFVIKFEKEHTKKDDRQGTAEESIKQSIKYSEGELPKKIDLLMPFYIGTDAEPFTVEIEIDSNGTAPVFSFYSLDVEAQLKKVAEDTINSELEDLRKDFTCIQLH